MGLMVTNSFTPNITKHFCALILKEHENINNIDNIKDCFIIAGNYEIGKLLVLLNIRI